AEAAVYPAHDDMPRRRRQYRGHRPGFATETQRHREDGVRTLSLCIAVAGAVGRMCGTSAEQSSSLFLGLCCSVAFPVSVCSCLRRGGYTIVMAIKDALLADF